MHQLGAPDVVKYQNPFFMEWETAVRQWTIPVEPTFSSKVDDLVHAKKFKAQKVIEAVSADAKDIATAVDDASTLLKEESRPLPPRAPRLSRN